MEKKFLEGDKSGWKDKFCFHFESDHGAINMSLPLLPGNSFSKTLGQEKFNKVRTKNYLDSG